MMHIKLLVLPFKKKEYIGHVEKRVGTALRKLKSENSGLGKDKLTDETIDKLQNYYGITIHFKYGIWREWKKTSTPVLCTVHASSESRLLRDHQYLPDSTSWCRYQQDKANNGPILPLPVISKLKSKYVRLSDDSLLTWETPEPKWGTE